MTDHRALTEDHGVTLRRNMLFEGLDDKELEKALICFDARLFSCRKGDIILSAGMPLDSFGILLKGLVQVCSDDIEGNRMIMATVTEGDSFGESLCFLKTRNSPVYIQATENADLLWLSPESVFSYPTDSFRSLLQRRFTSMLASRTLSMNSRIQILSKLTLRDKLVTYFSDIKNKTGNPVFSVPFNREDMASYMGTNRSALSRELSAMKKEGIIDYYKNTFRLITK